MSLKTLQDHISEKFSSNSQHQMGPLLYAPHKKNLVLAGYLDSSPSQHVIYGPNTNIQKKRKVLYVPQRRERRRELRERGIRYQLGSSRLAASAKVSEKKNREMCQMHGSCSSQVKLTYNTSFFSLLSSLKRSRMWFDKHQTKFDLMSSWS